MNPAPAGKPDLSPEPSMERLRWQCRRGMLELDLLFTTFLDKAYPSLTNQERRLFHWLIDQPDPLLLAWFMGREEPTDERLGRLIDQIRLVTSQHP